MTFDKSKMDQYDPIIINGLLDANWSASIDQSIVGPFSVSKYSWKRESFVSQMNGAEETFCADGLT